MLLRSFFVHLFLPAVLLFWLVTGQSARGNEITQHFPADQPTAKMNTQWRVLWDVQSHAGGSQVLVIKEAYFKRGPKEQEFKVLGDCRLGEIFVPYKKMDARIYDISAFRFPLVVLDKKALGPPCVTPGALYSYDGEEAERGPVVKEVHDGNVRWMNAANKTRRGQHMQLWSVLNAGNYRYIMLYQFCDDGMVRFRLGATAHNLFDSRSDETTHIHIGFWRLNIEMGDATRTRVSMVEYDSEGLKTVVFPLTAEKRIRWNPERFTRLRIESLTHKNKHVPSSPIGYELLPIRTGSARFNGEGEEFTLHDLWLTRHNSTELRPRDLHRYENGETLNGAVTLWHSAPVLHVARDEDFGIEGTRAGAGVAIAAWAGCDLKPRNFFASTPLYP